MKSSIAPRSARSLAAAVLLSLALVGQSFAAGWSVPTALTNASKASTGGLVTLGASMAVAVYANDARIVVRRSSNSGGSWSSPLRLSDTGQTPAIAGRANSVDVVWLQGSRIRYVRSTNSGASFTAPVALSPAGTNVAEPSVGRGANGLVVVAWLEATKPPCCDGPWTIRARVSTNGGSSFGPAKSLGQGWEPVAAAAKGVAYVAYEGIGGSDVGLHIRRTVDGGASWKAGAMFRWPDETLVRPRGLTITAAGRQAYVGYHEVVEQDGGGDASPTLVVRYRRTASNGRTWSAVRDLTSPSGPEGTHPVMSLNGGIVRAVYARYGEGVWFRQSSDGTTWTPEQQVSPATLEEYPIGVGYAGKPIVLYTGEDGTGFGPYRKDIFVVRGTP